MGNIYGGQGAPKLVFDNGLIKNLPNPIGPNKESLRLYDFKPVVGSTYVSEGNAVIEVNKKFQFTARFHWEPMEYKYLKMLFEAQNQPSFLLYVNNDHSWNTRVKVKSLDHNYFAGDNSQDSPGYRVMVEFIGTILLDNAGYGALGLTEGWGTNWGVRPDNQSP